MTISTDLGTLVYNNILANGDTLNYTTSTSIATVIQNYISELTTNGVTLSTNNPDFETLLVQMQQSLEANDAWIDILTSGSGQAILRFFASVGTMASLAQERGAQETMLQSAQLTSSIYAITNMLGVRIARQTPAQVSVSLYSSSATVDEIPAYTQFSIASNNYFNRVPIIFTPGGSQPILTTLYQGQILSDTYTASGVGYSSIEIGQNDFTVSDTDVIVLDETVPFNRVTNGLYQYGSTDYVWQDRTLPNGNASIQFGDGVYGVAPTAGDTITITYARTMGASGNGLANNQQVTCPSDSTITGITTTVSSGGLNQYDKEFYRNNAPFMYSSFGRCVTRRDYETQALQYTPNQIFDVLVQGQQEIAPSSTAYLNVISVSTIPNIPWTTNTWNTFSAWLQGYGIYQVSIIRNDPTQVVLNISVNVYAFSNVDLPSLQTNVENNITIGMTPARYSIGKSIMLSDIQAFVLGNGNAATLTGITLNAPNIDYFDIVTPTMDTTISGNTYVTLGTLTVTTAYSTRSYSNRLI